MNMLLCYSVVALALTALQATQTPGRVQTVEGRVSSDSDSPVRGAVVNVTMGPDRMTQTDTTDPNGRYALQFANGTGDYLVHITATGYRPFRRRVTRTPTDSVVAVDAKLTSVVQLLEGVRVQTRRLTPNRGGDGAIVEPGASEKLADGVVGSVGPDREGDLAQIAATLPGVRSVGDGVSVLGLDAGQTSATLNGMSFSGSDLPRDANTRTRVSYSTYDPARGGFSGAQIATELAQGNTFSNRRAHVTLDAPFLQFGDPVSWRLGESYTNVQASVGLDGMVASERFAYNLAAQAARRVSDVFSVASRDVNALAVAGVARDSAQRLLGILAARGIPAVSSSVPSSRRMQSASLVARVDHQPYVPGAFIQSKRTWGVLSYAKASYSGALGIGPTATPVSGGDTRSLTGMVQGHYSAFLGKDNAWLSETHSAFTLQSTSGSPYLALPGGRVLVSSEIPGLTPGIASLAFGGNDAMSVRRRAWTWETVHETQKYVRGAHRLKVYAQSRVDGTEDTPAANRLGTFAFNSLADIEANTPASYSRALFSPDRMGREWSGVLAFGDLWRKSPTFQLMYGARLEANRFTHRPPYNPAVNEAFRARTDAAPDGLHLSPRLGFTWVYGGEKNNRNGYGVSNLGMFYFGPRGVIRGGVGEFRGLLPPSLLSDASVNVGLPGETRSLTCFGAATPIPDWDAYLANPTTAPTECIAVPAAPVLADTAPNVQLFDRRYAAPRSWRANVSWNSQWKRLIVGADVVYSLNLNQPGTIDLNFAGSPGFTLADEAGRPVFVSPRSIVPATGAVSPVDGRRVAQFGRVVTHRSDLSSESRQTTLSLSPDFGYGRAVVSIAYTLGNVRRVFRGFDGATFASPLRRERSPADLDVRHQLTIQAGYTWKGYSFTVFSKAASGVAFTPLVGSDVNGDGLANDRAFVFAPAQAADSAVAEGVAELLAEGDRSARDCLRRYLGRVPARNGCRGPWTALMSARVGLSSALFKRLGNRVNASLTFANPLAGLDELIHGANDLRGWGGAALPNPVLYTVRGFDPATNRFRYEVNPRFGSTRPAQTTFRAPFRATFDVAVNWGVPPTRQQIARTLNVGRRLPGTRLTADSIRKRLARNVPSLYGMILRESDSLFLSRGQIEALQDADAKWKTKADSAWGVLAMWLAALPRVYDAKEAERRTEETTDAVWNLARNEGPTIRMIITPAQLKLAPTTVTYVITARGKIGIRYFSY
jgi:hypothetical protein